MITLSKPISAGQAQAYHKEEFANARENYYTEGERVRGEWQGQLASVGACMGEVQESSSRGWPRASIRRRASSWSGIRRRASM
jgi:hypothetical protein